MTNSKSSNILFETTRRTAMGLSLGSAATTLLRPVSALAASHESGSRTIRKGFVNTSHGQMHYRTAGSGPPVVLVHGSPSSSRTYIDLIGRLSDQFTVIALDTAGHGNSTPLMPGGQPEITDFARVLAETVEALGLERSVVFGSHTGAKITLQYAVDHPDRVSLLVMDGSVHSAGADRLCLEQELPYSLHHQPRRQLHRLRMDPGQGLRPQLPLVRQVPCHALEQHRP